MFSIYWLHLFTVIYTLFFFRSNFFVFNAINYIHTYNFSKVYPTLSEYECAIKIKEDKLYSSSLYRLAIQPNITKKHKMHPSQIFLQPFNTTTHSFSWIVFLRPSSKEHCHVMNCHYFLHCFKHQKISYKTLLLFLKESIF